MMAFSSYGPRRHGNSGPNMGMRDYSADSLAGS
jgi:hypothetical protein